MAEDVKVPTDEIPTKRQRLGDICYNEESTDIIETTNNDPDRFSNGQSEHDDYLQERAGSTVTNNKERDEEFREENDKVNEDEAETGVDMDDSDNVSVISDLSGLSEEAWKSSAGSLIWIQKQMMLGQDPRNILKNIIPQDAIIPEELDDFTLWKLVINLLSDPPKRDKLKHVNTLDDVVNLMKTCKKVIILTGAGVSVSCGIPDFRSRDGIYARLAIDFPDLPDPQAMFDIRYFRNDPRPFFKFAKEIYPGQFEPSKSHKFIRLFEDHNILLRNYTQNIDTLEQVAGIKNVIQCHGSFANATCMVCQHKVASDVIRNDIFEQVIPQCPKCPKGTEMAVMKPDIVFFGESLPEEFHRQMAEDKDICDLLIVIGSSLKVRPVALIPNSLPPSVPQILINREPLKHLNFDVELLGDCDTIVGELSKRLGEGWSDLSNGLSNLVEINRDELRTPPPEMLDSKPETKTQTDGENSGEKEHKENTEMIENIMTTKSQMDLEMNTLNPESDEKHQKKSDDVDTLLCENESKLDPGNTESLVVSDSCGERISCKNDPGGSTTDDDDLEKLRAMWQPRRKESIAKRLEDGQYLFLPPNRYVFQGAEVFSDDESDEEHFPDRLRLMSCSSMSSYEEESEIDTSSQSMPSVSRPSTSSRKCSEQPVKCLTSVDSDNSSTVHQQSNGIDHFVDDTGKTDKTQGQQELEFNHHDKNETPQYSTDKNAADIS